MAFSILLRKCSSTTTTSTILNHLRRHKQPSASVFSRSFAATPKGSNQQSKNILNPPFVIKGPEALQFDHPFQISGSKEVVEVDGTKKGTLVRVALPGVGEDGFKVWVKETTIFFQAKANAESDDEEPRMYGGSLEFNQEFNKVQEFKAEMRNGILRLLVPNVDGVDD
ncbi:hypothetical protein Leryth_023178 [Lithospermum erythrorhizon]|nr:hypothetical protein Leryth_023178 [Lithospermum erythrorhizon]